MIKDSIRELALSQDQATPPAEEAAVNTPNPQPDTEVISESDSDVEEENASAFDFALVEPFINAVKDAIQWEEDPEPPSKAKKYFPHLKKKLSTFPLNTDLSSPCWLYGAVLIGVF